MSIVLQGQPYAIYPSAYNPYEPANYKRFAAYSSLTKFDHEDCGDIHENGSSNEIRPEILSAKYSCSRESREQRPLEIPRRPVTSGHMKQAERRPQFKIIRKQLQENNDLGVNWLLTSKINLIPRPITSVTRKTIIPTPNMDMFEVKNNDFDNRNSVIKVTSASLIHPNCLPDRRPQSAASSNLASFHLTSPGTSRNISASTPRVTTPVSHLSARSTEVTKPDRPSSAPCFVKQSFASSSCGEKSQSY
ncbi:unnamed protein product [Heterobilharzia americana]|nr:unnamed protein product [Heterobilharzia americana]